MEETPMKNTIWKVIPGQDGSEWGAFGFRENGKEGWVRIRPELYQKLGKETIKKLALSAHSKFPPIDIDDPKLNLQVEGKVGFLPIQQLFTWVQKSPPGFNFDFVVIESKEDFEKDTSFKLTERLATDGQNVFKGHL
jgi:hypothetical protein